MIKIFYLVTCLFLISCTITTTRSKKMEMNKSADSLGALLSQFIRCENVSVDGFEKTENGKTTNLVSIVVLNGNEPADYKQKQALGMAVARVVRSSMTNASDFSIFEVNFLHQQKD